MGNAKTTLIGALISQGASVVIALAVSFGADLSAEQTAALMGAASFVGAVLTAVLWLLTLPKERVVEVLIGKAEVVAGEANELPTGEFIRPLNPDARRAVPLKPLVS